MPLCCQDGWIGGANGRGAVSAHRSRHIDPRGAPFTARRSDRRRGRARVVGLLLAMLGCLGAGTDVAHADGRAPGRQPDRTTAEAAPSAAGEPERAGGSRGDTDFGIRPTGAIHVDFGSVFGPDARVVGTGSDVTLRRGQVGFEWTLPRDLEFEFVWNFAGIPDTRGSLNTLAVAYDGWRPLRLVAGAFEGQFTLAESQSSRDLVVLERASIIDAVMSLAGGSGRLAAGGEYLGDRLFGAAYLTGENANTSGDRRQRGAQLRVAGAPLRSAAGVLHLGVSGSWVFRPALSAGRPSIGIEGEPELAPGTRTLLDTGQIAARGARTEGIELGFSRDRFTTRGEYHRILVDRSGGSGQATFDGWYVDASYVLRGRPREWTGRRGGWDGPRPDAALSPATGDWGALELGLQYGRLDLDSADIRGGNQEVWSAALSWYPTGALKVMVQYQVGQVTPEGGDRAARYDAVGLRLQTTF